MKSRMNQSGYALIIVLLTITLIGIMTSIILSIIMNNNLQYHKTEEKLQLNKLTEMGKVYIENAVDSSTKKARDNTLSWISSSSTAPNESQITSQYLVELNKQLLSYVPGNQYIKVLKENSYQYKLNAIIDSTAKKIKYIITPSLNGIYDNKNSVNGEISINLNITKNIQ